MYILCIFYIYILYLLVYIFFVFLYFLNLLRNFFHPCGPSGAYSSRRTYGLLVKSALFKIRRPLIQSPKARLAIDIAFFENISEMAKRRKVYLYS